MNEVKTINADVILKQAKRLKELAKELELVALEQTLMAAPPDPRGETIEVDSQQQAPNESTQELIVVMSQVFQYLSWLSYSRELDADEGKLLDRVRGILHKHDIVTNDLVWNDNGWPSHDLEYDDLMKFTDIR